MKAALVMAHLSRASGGLARSVPGLAKALEGHGVQANIIGVRDPLAPDEAADWGSGVHACSSRGPRVIGWSPELARTLAHLDPDVADTQHLWMFPSLAVVRWSKGRRKPFVVTPRGMLDPWAVRRSAWKKRIVRLWFEDAHLKNATCIRALNEAEARAIRAFGLTNPIAIVPNGVDLPALGPDRVPIDPPTLLFLGRIDPKKGVHELVRAWARLGPARGDWRLRLVGWGPAAYVDATRRLIDELSLAGSIELAGPLFGAAKDEAFRTAEAFILPSRGEGLPMAVLEAWSYALPVLMTPACNLPEGFTAGAALEIGTDPAAIARGIRGLIALPEAERRAMGARGRRLVEERFTWPRVAAAMAEVYRWVAGGGPRPACVGTD
jgi:glycosyltransferase involved in cell wall biosynthesis